MTFPADGPAARPKSGTPYLTVRPDADAPLRLFCFHHAGGGASIFAQWQRALGPSVAVVPVQLPGRERRVREPRLTDMAALVRELDEHLDPFLHLPYAFYGHSMGGLVAWNLTRFRSAADRRLPEVLLVGACNPPSLPPVSATTLGMSQDRLVQWLVEAGGISEMVLRYPDWVEAATRMLRDDLDLCNSHRHADVGDSAVLPCPIHAFAGQSDLLVGPEAMAGWARHTGSSCELHAVPGGHLFLRDRSEHFLGLLRSVLGRSVPEPAHSSGFALQEGMRRS